MGLLVAVAPKKAWHAGPPCCSTDRAPSPVRARMHHERHPLATPTASGATRGRARAGASYTIQDAAKGTATTPTPSGGRLGRTRKAIRRPLFGPDRGGGARRQWTVQSRLLRRTPGAPAPFNPFDLTKGLAPMRAFPPIEIGVIELNRSIPTTTSAEIEQLAFSPSNVVRAIRSFAGPGCCKAGSSPMPTPTATGCAPHYEALPVNKPLFAQGASLSQGRGDALLRYTRQSVCLL